MREIWNERDAVLFIRFHNNTRALTSTMCEPYNFEKMDTLITTLLKKRTVTIEDIKELSDPKCANQHINLYLMAAKTSGLEQHRVATLFGVEDGCTNFLYVKHDGKWKLAIGERECTENLFHKLEKLACITEELLLLNSFSGNPHAECGLSVLVLVKDVDEEQKESKSLLKVLDRMEKRYPAKVISPSTPVRRADLLVDMTATIFNKAAKKAKTEE